MQNELLAKLGFSEKEIAVYLTVLENGKILPANVAAITKIKRPTVYAIARELIKKGVITQDIDSAGGYLAALPPSHLNTLVEKQEKEISDKKKVVAEAIKELDLMPKSKSYSIPRMRFIDEYNIRDFLYKQTSVWEESMVRTGNLTWWGFQDHTFVETEEYRDWIDWYWKRARAEIDLKLISNDSVIEEEMSKKNYDRRTIRFWRDSFKFTATNWVLGEYVILIMTKHRPHYIVEIHDSVYAENMRQVFRNLWEII